jgi:hypothetical protein
MFGKYRNNKQRVTTGKEEKKTCNNSSLFVTLSPTRTEVTDFNDSDSQPFDAWERIVDNGRKCTEDIGNTNVVDQHNLDSGEGFEREWRMIAPLDNLDD